MENPKININDAAVVLVMAPIVDILHTMTFFYLSRQNQMICFLLGLCNCVTVLRAIVWMVTRLFFSTMTFLYEQRPSWFDDSVNRTGSGCATIDMAVPRRAVVGAGRGGFDVTAHSPHRLSSLTYLPQEDHAAFSIIL